MSTSIKVQSCQPWLEGKSSNHTSQFGEDGLIQAALERIGVRNRWCFEVGASDGLYYSNTKRLRDQGWQCLLIEGNPSWQLELEKRQSTKVRTLLYKIGPNDLDRILWTHGAPRDLDVGVIDIDGIDFWAWAGMHEYLPRILLVEVAANQATAIPSPLGTTKPIQAGQQMMESLGISKGYTLVATTHCNCLFILTKELSK